MRKLIILLVALGLIGVAYAIQWDWIGGEPVQTNNTVFEWSGGEPYVIMEAAVAATTTTTTIPIVEEDAVTIILTHNLRRRR